MHVDFKVISWVRVEIPEHKETEALELLEQGAVQDAYSLAGILEIEEEPVDVSDSTEYVAPNDSVGTQTITAFDSDGEEIYTNGGK